MNIPRFRQVALLAFSAFCLSSTSRADTTENFDTYPNGGSGWTGGGWTSNGVSAGVQSTTPLDGGGSYLSIVANATATTAGIRRNIGTVAANPYTVTFDYRLDSSISAFDAYNDRLHIGVTSETTSPTLYGTAATWGWFVGVVGADENVGNQFADRTWYFYNNASTSANGTFALSNMVVTNITLTQGVTYSFTIDVNPSAQTYSASMSGSDGSSFSSSNLNFRNQTSAVDTITNLVFGSSTTSGTDNITYSVDSIQLVPEPSSATLLALSGLACFFRRRASR